MLSANILELRPKSTLPPPLRAFILEDMPARVESFRRVFREAGVEVCWAANVEAAKRLWEPPYKVALLDHDLEDAHYNYYTMAVDDVGTGYDFVKWLGGRDAGNEQRPLMIIHSYNLDGAKRMVNGLREGGFQAVQWPFANDLLEFLKIVVEK